jgi:hypothetical protein
MNISISRNGVEIGEWPENDVRTLYREGSLMGTDYYWREGMEEWKPLLSLVKPPPPTPMSKETDSSLPAISGERKDKDSKWNGGTLLYWVAAVVVIILAKTVVGPLIGYGAAYYPDIAVPMLAGGMIGFILCLIPACVARYYYKTKHADRYIWVPTLAGAVVGLLLALVNWPAHYDSYLAKESVEVNKTLPKMVNDFIRLDSTSTSLHKTWHYHYTLLKSKPGLDSAQLNEIFKSGALNAYKTSPDLQIFRDNGITIDHDYYDANGDLVGTVEVGPKDLP